MGLVDAENRSEKDVHDIDLPFALSPLNWLPKKIISGGQAGADRAALDWAIRPSAMQRDVAELAKALVSQTRGMSADLDVLRK